MPDWDSYKCVVPTTTECYDCTTTSKQEKLKHVKTFHFVCPIFKKSVIVMTSMYVCKSKIY